MVRNKIPTTQGIKLCVSVQKNGTPFRNPRNNGGSPIGVSEPPTLLIIKIKKMIWYDLILSLFNRIKGRISNIEAPVVPMILAITAPIKRIITFAAGVDFLSTLIMMPPEAINSPVNSEKNCTYSNPAWTVLGTLFSLNI
jgi:hypothetical protein